MAPSISSPPISAYGVDMSDLKIPDTSNDLFKEPILEDDPLWAEYTEKAALFDQNIIEDWNKIVDVTLIFVGLIISTLTSYIIQTSKQFTPDPAEVTNQLLVAMYQQLIALSNNSSIQPIDIPAVFKLPEKDYKNAMICNALLYTSLGLCSVVAVFALAAKLWLISYGHHTSSVGPPYERAMMRQKAYSGVQAWKMGAVIQSLPLILLVALVLFGFFIHTSIWSTNKTIGYVVGTLLTLSFIALGVTSLAAAFIPACPFHSPFSTIIRVFFKIFEEAYARVPGGMPRLLRNGILTVLWIGSAAVIAWATIMYSSAYFLLVYIPIALTFAYSMKEKVTHKVQNYRLPRLSLWVFLAMAPILAAAAYFRNPQKSPIFVTLYVVGLLVLCVFGFTAGRLSKAMDGTAEIDAITWLLTSAPTPNPALFKKAGRIVNSPGGRGYRPRLLRSLMPFLSPIIVSHRPDMEPQDLEIYLSCLACLSDFKDTNGTILRMKEDEKSHPKLEEPLRKKLVELASHQSDLRWVAIKVLNQYEFDDQGIRKPPKWSRRKRSGDTASVMSGESEEMEHPFVNNV